MSNFFCPTCQKPIFDTPGSIPTGCVHFPPKTKTPDIPDFISDLFKK